MKKYLTSTGRGSLMIMLFSIVAINFGVMSCSDDDENTPTESPGTITVSAAGITGQSGKVLVITASNPSNPSAGIIGVYCQGGLTDPFSLPATLLQTFSASGNPCEATNTTKTFEGGSYLVSFSVLEGGSQSPEKTTSVSVTVDGDITVAAPDFSTWE